MNQRTNEIERDIEQTRAEMSDTIDAIQERLSPGQLFEQALHYFSSGGGRSFTDGAGAFAVNLGRTMRDNPVPVALVATGLTWLMVAHNRRPPGSRAYREQEDLYYDEAAQVARYGSTEELAARYDERMGRREGATLHESGPAFAGPYGPGSGPYESPPDYGAAQRETEPADPTARRPGVSGSTVGAAAVNPGGGPGGGDSGPSGGRAHEAASNARERASEAAQKARWQAAHIGGRAHGNDGAQQQGSGQRTWRARRQAERARSGFRHMLEERPLVVGLIGVAIGAALGAMLPPTRREDEWLGETRDDLARRARAEVDKVERVAGRAVDTARSEAERQELTPEGARRAARETVQETERAAQERIQEAAQDVVREAEHSAEAKAKNVGERLREVGEATREAAKDETKRQDVGSGRPRRS